MLHTEKEKDEEKNEEVEEEDLELREMKFKKGKETRIKTGNKMSWSHGWKSPLVELIIWCTILIMVKAKV